MAQLTMFWIIHVSQLSMHPPLHCYLR